MENKKDWTPPTGIAKEVYEWLHDRAKSVKDARARVVAERCGMIPMCMAFGHVDPRVLAMEAKSLIEKGLVKEFTFDGLPSLIPVSYCSVEVVTARPLTQSDIDNG